MIGTDKSVSSEVLTYLPGIFKSIVELIDEDRVGFECVRISR